MEFPEAESWILPSEIASPCAARILEKLSIMVLISIWPRRETLLSPGFRRALKIVAWPRTRSSLLRFRVTFPWRKGQWNH